MKSGRIVPPELYFTRSNGVSSAELTVLAVLATVSIRKYFIGSESLFGRQETD